MSFGGHEYSIHSRNHCEPLRQMKYEFRTNQWRTKWIDLSNIQKSRTYWRPDWAEEINNKLSGCLPSNESQNLQAKRILMLIQSKHPCVACICLLSIETETFPLTLFEENRLPRRTEEWLYTEKFEPRRTKSEWHPRPDVVLCSRCGCSDRVQINPVLPPPLLIYNLFFIMHLVSLVSSLHTLRMGPLLSCLQPIRAHCYRRISSKQEQYHWEGRTPFIILS